MLEVDVCIGSSCHLKGSYNLIQAFQQLLEEHNLHEKVTMKAQFCMKNCQNGVSVTVGGEVYGVSPQTARDFFRDQILSRV